MNRVSFLREILSKALKTLFPCCNRLLLEIIAFRFFNKGALETFSLSVSPLSSTYLHPSIILYKSTLFLRSIDSDYSTSHEKGSFENKNKVVNELDLEGG
jgi:hypothetical protein